MPFITIRSLPFPGDIAKITEEISRTLGKKTSFSESRLMIQWNFDKPEIYFRHGSAVTDFYDSNYELVINVTCSLRNQKEQIDILVEVLAKTVSDLLDFDPERISVIINAKEPGSLYVSGKFI